MTSSRKNANLNFMNVKNASIKMMALGGYDVSHDAPILNYVPDDMDEYIDQCMDYPDSNVIREALHKSGLLTPRSSMSSLYESIERPGYFAMVFFSPTLGNFNSVSKKIIQVPVAVCLQNAFEGKEYCVPCSKRIDSIKKCINCPSQKYCPHCAESSSCEECPSNKFCVKCVNKIRGFEVHEISRYKCKKCPIQGRCLSCKKGKCGKCEDDEKDDFCETCVDNLKCKKCDDDFCDDCICKKDLEPCEECPIPQFCRDCSKNPDLKQCKRCPPASQVIERCVIITEIGLSADAKQAASANIPKVKASTGELLETGCLIQVFLDTDILHPPLVHSMGARYQVLSSDEAVEFFSNAKNNIKEHQIHQLDMAAPISKYLGLYPGQVVRVQRETVIPGTLLTHEIVHRIVKMIPKSNKNRRCKKKKSPPMASGKIVS